MKVWKKGRQWALVAAILAALALGAPQVQALNALPERITLPVGSSAGLGLAGDAKLEAGSTQAALADGADGIEIHAGEQSGTANLILRLLGIPVKDVQVQVSDERRLIPGGQSVGIAIETDGLVVVGASDLGHSASPARLAGLKGGDVITHANGVPLRTADDLAVQLQPGETAELTILRDGKEQTLKLTPATDARDGQPRIGAWVRSSTAGVGTLTYIDPENGNFGALGHAIADVDTGVTLPVAEGGLYESRVVEVRRGQRGVPGEIVGDFFSNEKQIGELSYNCDYGVFGGDYAGDLAALPYPEGLPIGTPSQLQTGKAQILTTVDDQIRAYDCEIERIDPQGGMRSIVLHITDEALLARTGGIVQGMSGSPILQNGRIVGAVTHVFVNDPSRGYGIFIQDMLEAA